MHGACSDRRFTILAIDSERGWRGGERQVLLQASALVQLGHRVVIAARPGEPLMERAIASGIETMPCRPAAEFDPFAARALRRAIIRERINIVHAHTGHATALGALATLGTPAKFVITRHTDFRLRRGLPTAWKYGRAAMVIAVSEAVARALVASGMAPARIEVVYGGTDQSRPLVPASREALAALGVPASAPLVVQVSQLVPHKDPLTFVAAIDVARRTVPALHALLVGDGPLRRQVEAAVVRRAMQDVLHVVGFRTDAEALLAAADVVTLSSVDEAFGTVLVDALHCGKPIVATAAGGIPEVVEHVRSGLLVPVRDADAFGTAIATVLTDPCLASRFAIAAADRAHKFSVEHSVRRIEAIYQRVLCGS